MIKKEVWQNHHISYDPPVVVRIRKSVHYICTKIQRHTRGLTDAEKRAIIQAVRQQYTRGDKEKWDGQAS